MIALLPFTLLLELFMSVGATPIDAAHPMITQRAELFGREAVSSLVGYYYTTDYDGNTVITSSEKPGSVLTLSGSSLIDFCSDDPSYLSSVCPTAYWTSCSGATLYSEGGSSSCAFTCDYDIIYTANTVDSSPLIWYHCMERDYLVFYREQPSGTLIEDAFTTTSSSSDSSSDSSTNSASNTASPASSGASTGASQTSNPTGTPTPEQEKKESKAWIAGVVIGIVGLLAVAGMGFYLWRQRRQQAYQPAPQGPQTQPGYPPQQYGYPIQNQPYGSPSPGLHPLSPNMTVYDEQTQYGQITKPQEGVTYAQYGSPPVGVGVAQMPPIQPPMQPPVQQSYQAGGAQDLPELASSPNRS